MKKNFSAIVVLGLSAVLLGGCNEGKVAATASCGQVELFESNLGFVNIPHFVLGNYFWVDPKNKTAGGLGVLPSGNNDRWDSPVTNEMKVNYDSKLSIAFDAQLPEAEAAALRSQITKTTELIAHSVKRTSLGDVAGLLNANAAAKKVIVDHLRHAPGNVIYVVHSVLNANDLSIALANASSSNANVSIVKYGKFELSVNYQCGEALAMSGTQSSAFFKVTAIGYDTATNSLYVDTSEKLSLADIPLSQAIQTR